MRTQMETRASKWPFFAGDAVLLGAAYLVYSQARLPLGVWEMGCIAGCVAAGAALACTPYLLDYRAAVKLAEVEALTTVVSQVKSLEEIAALIRGATSQWQEIQAQAGQTAGTAKHLVDHLSAEARAFTEFLQRANDSEKATLRLETEKLRRGENDWLQVLVRMLDHVYALHQGALRSGQPKLIEQLGLFQNACCDAARRVGLAPFVAEPDQGFDAQRHQAVEGNGQPPAEAIVEETVATGYTFQGRLLRPALVRLRKAAVPEPAAVAAAAQPVSETGQGQLPLGSDKG